MLGVLMRSVLPGGWGQELLSKRHPDCGPRAESVLWGEVWEDLRGDKDRGVPCVDQQWSTCAFVIEYTVLESFSSSSGEGGEGENL